MEVSVRTASLSADDDAYEHVEDDLKVCSTKASLSKHTAGTQQTPHTEDRMDTDLTQPKKLLSVSADRSLSSETDAVRAYCAEISRIPLLKAEQEVFYAQRIEQGDEKAKAMLTEANLRLVVSIAKRYTWSEIPMGDLIGEGNIGLLRAVERYDWRRGTRFSTHATWWIRQSVSRAVADKSRCIRFPVYVSTRLNRLRQTELRLHQELGRPPTVDELVASTGYEREQIEDLQSLPFIAASLEQPLGEDGDMELGDMIVESDAPSTEEAALTLTLPDAVQDVLSSVLKPREHQVLQLHFGLGKGRKHTLAEVGHQLHITRERVRQIEESALQKLRSPEVLVLLSS